MRAAYRETEGRLLPLLLLLTMSAILSLSAESGVQWWRRMHACVCQPLSWQCCKSVVCNTSEAGLFTVGVHEMKVYQSLSAVTPSQTSSAQSNNRPRDTHAAQTAFTASCETLSPLATTCTQTQYADSPQTSNQPASTTSLAVVCTHSAAAYLRTSTNVSNLRNEQLYGMCAACACRAGVCACAPHAGGCWVAAPNVGPLTACECAAPAAAAAPCPAVAQRH